MVIPEPATGTFVWYYILSFVLCGFCSGKGPPRKILIIPLHCPFGAPEFLPVLTAYCTIAVCATCVRKTSNEMT